MSLSDENSSMVNALGKAQFENLSLKSSLQEILEPQAEHVIKLHLSLIEHTDTDQATQKCITCKQTKLSKLGSVK